MHTKRKIRVSEVVNDIRSGLTSFQLMRKYRVSSKGLRRIFQRLVDARIMPRDELDGHSALYDSGQDTTDLRRCARKRMRHPASIYDEGDPFKGGRVLDISATGVRLEGIKTYAGEVKTFLARLGDTYMSSIVFQAKCRWARSPAGPGAKWMAGFQITNISNPCRKELFSLIER